MQVYQGGTMAAGIPSVVARDLSLRVDGCNCCGWGKAPAPDTRVYVNSRGDVLVFDPKKTADEREAMRRTLSNLHHVIEDMAKAREKDKEEILRKIEREVVPLKPESPTPPVVTLGMIARISNLLNGI